MTRFPALRTYVLLRGLLALFNTTIFSIAPLFRISAIGMSPLELVAVGTLLEASIFVCEIPTGVVADTYSRRLSVIIGVALIGLASVIEGALASLAGTFIAQAVWGVGYTFTSGATEAWIVDELGEAGAAPALLRGAQAEQIGVLAGIPCGMLLASGALWLPLVVGGAGTALLAALLAAVMPERGFRPTPQAERSTWRQLADTFGAGAGVVRRSSLLLTILALTAIAGASSEGFDRLWPYHLTATIGLPAWGGLSPVIWFGLLNGAAAVLSMIATRMIAGRFDETRQRRVARALLGIDLLLIAALALFALAGNFAVAALGFLAVTLLRRISGPLRSVWINQHIPSGVRATVLSMNSQFDALGQIGGGPVLGFIGNRSVRAALVAAALFLAPGIGLYQRT
ncbi:MAG TPA: MFS transporter, partial [Herpetosiphonaceae bacterium]